MGAKGKRRRNNKKRLQPQRTFRDMIADATLNKFSGYINQEINNKLQTVTKHIVELNEQLVATQEILLQEVPGFTSESLTEATTVVVDRKYGLVKVEGRAAQKGDSLRVTIKTRLKDQEDFGEHSSPMLIHQVGSGQTLKEVEEGMIGMNVGEVKEIANENGEAFFQVTLDRISEPKVKPEAKEESSEDSNEG